jgi:hypothetical protein
MCQFLKFHLYLLKDTAKLNASELSAVLFPGLGSFQQEYVAAGYSGSMMPDLW